MTRKISRGVAQIKLGIETMFHVGNLDARRDWGHAKDYVEGMWRILQYREADDFVLATGETHSVREFIDLAFKEVDINIEWRGKGTEEKAVDTSTGDVVVEVNPRYFRPTEVDVLLGDSSKAYELLGWKHKTGFADLVKEMVQSDLRIMGKINL